VKKNWCWANGLSNYVTTVRNSNGVQIKPSLCKKVVPTVALPTARASIAERGVRKMSTKLKTRVRRARKRNTSLTPHRYNNVYIQLKKSALGCVRSGLGRGDKKRRSGVGEES